MYIYDYKSPSPSFSLFDVHHHQDNIHHLGKRVNYLDFYIVEYNKALALPYAVLLTQLKLILQYDETMLS